MEHFFTTIDKNHDGLISHGEWRAGYARHAPAMVMASAVDIVYNRFLPVAAFASLFCGLLLLARTVAVKVESRVKKLPRFGRKGLIITSSSVLFAASCLYRATFVADEGASLCRGPSSLFNAPVAGRFVATVGELALVVQLTAYLSDTAQRLRVPGRVFAARRRRTLIPAVLAECLSWTGVLSSIPQFFCAEYLCWCVIGGMWAWDAAELLHRSSRWGGDALVHAIIVLASLSLVAFNACHELPHFFYAPSAPSAAEAAAGSEQATAPASAWACTADAASPLWQKRLPFFVCYFFVSSWCSTALAARHYLRGASRSKSA